MKGNVGETHGKRRKLIELPLKLIKTVEKFIDSFGFSFAISWKASVKYFSIRIMLEIVSALLPFASVFLGREIINLLVSFAGSNDFNLNISRLAGIMLMVLLVGILGKAVQRIKEYVAGIHGEIIGNYINLQIAEKTAALDISFFDSPKFYDGIVNVRRDSNALQTLTWFTVDIIRSFIQLAVASCVLATLNWAFVLMLLVLCVPSIVIEKKFTEHLYKWTRNQAPEERKMGYIMSILSGGGGMAKDTRLFNLYPPLIDRYHRLWEKWFSGKRKILFKSGMLAALTSIMPEVGIIGILFYSGVKIASGQMTLGDYTLYAGITDQIVNSIFMLIHSFAQIYDNNMRIANYTEFLNWKPNQMPSGKLIPSYQPSIEFVDVSFKYPCRDEYILRKVDFKILPGEKVALVGLNGAGKSTIVKLILRFYDPSEGRILIDGVDIHNYDVIGLRKVFGVLLQDFVNYAFTARESVTISDLENEKDDLKVSEACRMSGVDEMAAKWEKGLDTFLTREYEEDGIALSGGEWQKIALARTFFRNAGIVILDEPSSSLDAEAEHRIFMQFAEVCRDKGAIFISHRLSNVIMADKILVVDEGKIIESGSHHELMKLKGRYAYLFGLQADKYIKAC